MDASLDLFELLRKGGDMEYARCEFIVQRDVHCNRYDDLFNPYDAEGWAQLDYLEARFEESRDQGPLQCAGRCGGVDRHSTISLLPYHRHGVRRASHRGGCDTDGRRPGER